MNRANIFLTRRCNFKCKGCNVITKQYPELTLDGWYNVFSILKQQGVRFIQLYGGEPTLRDDLPEMIEFLNAIKVSHTIVTNSARLLSDKDYYRRFLNSNPFGITCSHNGSSEKLLSVLKTNGYIGDLACNLMIDKNSIKEIPEIIFRYSALGISMVVFFLHNGEEWEFRGPSDDEVDDLSLIISMAEWFLVNYDNLLLYNSRRYFEAWNRYAITKDWKCSEVTSLQVNCDGRISICQDMPPTNYSVLDLLDKKDEALQACLNQSVSCSGCFYDCYFEHDNLGRLHIGKK